MAKEPKWTVLYNIVSPESPKWIGTGWEFFDSQGEAYDCRKRHETLGNVATVRPYHPSDRPHLGAGHFM